MRKIEIVHIKENREIDFAYIYDENIEMALRDIDKIEDKNNFMVVIHDDTMQGNTKAYCLDSFKYIYGGTTCEEWQADQEKDRASKNFTTYMMTKQNLSKNSVTSGE